MWQLLGRYSSLRNLGIFAVEFVALVSCTLLAFRLRFLLNLRAAWGGEYLLLKAIVIAVVFQIGGYFLDLNEFSGPKYHALRRRALAVVYASGVVLCASWLSPELLGSRGVLAITLILIALFYLVWHAGLAVYFDRGPRSNVLVIGTNRLAQDVAREIIKRPEMRMHVAGFITTDPAMVGVRLVNPGVIGMTEELPRLVNDLGVRRVVVALSDRRGVLPLGHLLALKCRGVTIEEGTSIYERVTGKIALENLKPSWLIFNEGFQVSKRMLLLKNMFSFVVSVLLGILTSPVMLLAAAAIKLESRGPVFFKQERVGLNGRVFQLWKFRSMRQHAEAETGPVWAVPGDPRVTRVGRILRKTRIDELPQLLNVFRGDMHFVGPRPERPEFVRELQEKIPYYGLRHMVKPGITGWAQINYGYGRNEEDTVEKLQYDLFYIKNLSVVLDFLVVLETVKAVIKGRGI